MSHGSGAEGMARLRRAVGEIEARSGPAETRAPGAGLSLTRALDRALGGGLAGDALHEIVPATPSDGAAAMGFALALAARFMAEHSAAGLLMAEDFAARDMGALYGPGLVAHGLELGRLVFVRAPDAPALFQAMEEALKSGAPAVVVGEVWRLQKYDLAVSHRLLLPSAGGRGLAGRPAFAARLVKARLTSARGPPIGLDVARVIRLTWRSEDKQFDETSILPPLVAASAYGSRAAGPPG